MRRITEQEFNFIGKILAACELYCQPDTPQASEFAFTREQMKVVASLLIDAAERGTFEGVEI